MHTVGYQLVHAGLSRDQGRQSHRQAFERPEAERLATRQQHGRVGGDTDLLQLDHRADFRRFYRLEADEYTDIALRVRNPNEVAKVAEKAGVLLRQHRIVTRADLLRTYEALFSWREGLLLAMLAAAVLAFGILVFDKASGLSAQERREIGILEEVGWDTRDVIHLKLWEAALIAATAFLGGTLAAYVHVFVFDAPSTT